MKVGENGWKSSKWNLLRQLVSTTPNYFIPSFCLFLLRLFSVSSPFSLWSQCLHFNFLRFILSWWSLVWGLIFSVSFYRGGPWSKVCVFTFINFIFEISLLYSLIATVLHSLLSLKVFPVGGWVSFILFSGKLSSYLLCRLASSNLIWMVGMLISVLHVFSFLFCETDLVIRFKKKRNGFQNPFDKFYIFFRNEIRNSFQKSMERISKFVS